MQTLRWFKALIVLVLLMVLIAVSNLHQNDHVPPLKLKYVDVENPKSIVDPVIPYGDNLDQLYNKTVKGWNYGDNSEYRGWKEPVR